MLSNIKLTYNKLKYTFPSSTVLMFHHVTDTPEFKRSILMNTQHFLQVIDTFNCYCDIHSAVSDYRRKKMTVTFDDALLDVYTIAYKELVKRNIPFTIFVAKDLLNQNGYVSFNQLIEMAENPLVTIGSHCVTHTPMRGKTVAEQTNELLESKMFLEKLIHKEIVDIAYPYGQCDKNTIKIIRKNNLYQHGFLASGGPINSRTSGNPIKLPRLRVDDKTFIKSMEILKHAYG